MRQFFDTFSTPIGEFSVALNAGGDVIATAFGDFAELRERFEPDEVARDAARAADVRREVGEYFAGARKRFGLKLAPRGTPFQGRVWAALAGIPYGETRTYGQIAAELGNPDASRAVGRANATNPICLIVPCHRVIGTDGSMTGFAFGADLKRWLLRHEGASAAALV